MNQDVVFSDTSKKGELDESVGMKDIVRSRDIVEHRVLFGPLRS